MSTEHMHSKYHAISAKKHYSSELARLTTGLFIAVIALMTFLLTVGLSHPDKTFEYFLYATLIILPLSLLAYIVGQSMLQMMWSKKLDSASKSSDQMKGKWKALKVTRAIQQILFVLGLIAVAGLALATAHFFFAAQAAQTQSQAQQQAAPAPTQ